MKKSIFLFNLFVIDFLQGPPLAGKYDMGALCMHEHSEKLDGLLNDAIDKGAEIVARGSLGNIGEDAVDQYFPPTVIVNVNHSMRLMQEEVTKLAIFSTSHWHDFHHLITVSYSNFFFSQLHWFCYIILY